MVRSSITLQALNITKSVATGALIEEWVNIGIIQGQVNKISTYETVKGVRTYVKKSVILTKCKGITAENNRLIIDGIIYVIDNVTSGVWNVITAKGQDTC
uniref:Uncharacterized protein n=1 Tax=Dulem virus 30 TaxID=3145748 RepID=A0AAU8B4G8_9CAUD